MRIRCSTRRDGDFHLEAPAVAVAHRRAGFQSGRWTQLDEVHGTDVVVVAAPGAHDGAVGDAMVSSQRGAVLGIWVGDCAPVAFVSDDGWIGGAHAGWRGALDGVLEATVTAMRREGALGPIRAFLGPCIHQCCYEFGADDLLPFEHRFGPQVVGHTSWGTPSLHMPAVVAACLAPLGVMVDERMGGCTRCNGERWFSHRAGDAGRQVLTVTKMASA